MQLNEKYQSPVVSADIQPVSFSIASNRKAFEVLVADLYSKKIPAVVREISTNAADAHTEAGCRDKPFLVHMPDKDEPYFSVRDYGNGMSAETVTTLYTTCFASTRDRSNDATGCFGLGSKSPFCYGDSFQVTSWHAGVCRTYSAFMNDHGPQIACIGEVEDTESPSGVEIRIPVKLDDLGRFRMAGSTIYAYFNVPPLIDGDCPIQPPVYVIRGADYGIVLKHRGYSQVIMGNVAYPLGTYDISLPGGINTELLRTLLGHGVDLYMPIGSVAVTPSRESLSLTEQTRSAIQAKFTLLQQAAIDSVAETIADAQSRWDARARLNKIAERLVWAKEWGTSTWQGQTINVAIEAGEPVRVTNRLTGEQRDSTLGACAAVVKLKRKGSKEQFYATPRIEIDNPKNFVASRIDKVVLIDDVEKDRNAHIRRAMEDLGVATALLFDEQKVPEQWLEEEGLSGVVMYLSAWPRPKVTRRKVVKTKGQMAAVTISEWRIDIDDWAERDLTGGGFYVPVSRQSLVCSGNKESKLINRADHEHAAVLTALLKQHPIKGSLYGVGLADIPQLKKAGDWVNLFDWLGEKAQAAIDANAAYLALSLAIPVFADRKFLAFARRRYFREDSAMTFLKKGLQDVDCRRTNLAENLLKARSRLEAMFAVKMPDPNPDIAAVLAAVKAQYPLIPEFYIDDFRPRLELVRYIRAIDDSIAADAEAVARLASLRRKLKQSPKKKQVAKPPKLHMVS